MTIRIITLSGASGAGKSSYCRELLTLAPEDFGLVPSDTDRTPRSRDLPGEYVYVDGDSFCGRSAAGYLWIASAHGHSYGTLRSSVLAALRSAERKTGVMPILPDYIGRLRTFLSMEGASVLHFWCLSPDEAVMRERLARRVARGDMTSDEAEGRIVDCRQADDEAVASGIPYLFIPARIAVGRAASYIVAMTTEVAHVGN